MTGKESTVLPFLVLSPLPLDTVTAWEQSGFILVVLYIWLSW